MGIRNIVPALVAALAIGFAPAAAQAAPILMKIGTATNYDSQFQWMKVYKKMVEHDSKGRIKVELFPSSQLGAIGREIEGVQFGSIQGWVGPPDFLSGVDKRYQVLEAPGLFDNLEQATRTLEDPTFNKAFLALGANKGIKGIALFLYGPYGFNTKRPVHKLSDLKGMKIRVTAAEMQMKQVRVLGATPVPMTLGDVAAALQQGTIDGQMAGSSLVAAMKFYMSAKYMFASNQSMVTSIAIVSKTWFDKLPPDLQKVVTEDAQRAAHSLEQWNINFVRKMNTVFTKFGGVLVIPTAAQHAKLMRLMKPIGREVTSEEPGEAALYKVLLQAVARSK